MLKTSHPLGKIVLGMSGGVDSSVCAYLLKKQGYQVIGLFMQNWDTYINNDIRGHLKTNDKYCNAQKDFTDAQKVAHKLGIEIHRTEFIEQYWKKVFSYLIKEYRAGRTPNPDILCNKYIKFHEFIKYALKHFHTSHIAMGHYANVVYKNKKYLLTMAKDKEKDQTYFLCWLTQKQLKHTKFPIGNLTKNEVRKIAKQIGLSNWNKKDSTGICFIGERNFKQFLNNYLPDKKGNVINIETNQKIGIHDGVAFYTYGQNKGLGLSGQTQKYFVCAKDIKQNILYVCDTKHINKHLISTKCELTNFNWINNIPKIEKVQIRFRHRQKLINGSFVIRKNKIILAYHPTLSVTLGQFAVLYQENICLGGGIVNHVFK